MSALGRYNRRMKIDFPRSFGFALLAALCVALVAGPALAQPSYAIKHETIHGRIASFDGHFALTVRDDRGYLDRVTLRDGTVINPTGLRLAAGMQVTIIGETAGSAFVAFEIDTPYSVQPQGYAPAYEPPPTYAQQPGYAPEYTAPYPPPYYPVYPYPAYPYPAYPVYYPYPYFSLGLDILIGGRGRSERHR